MTTICVVGDYQPANETHIAVADSVKHSAAALDLDVEARWIATDEIAGVDLESFDGLWIAPGSPYRSFEGALEAITWGRSNDVPLIGTCAGFQHAVIEFARNVVGVADAHHAEYETATSTLVIDSLACSLAGQTMDVTLAPGSKAHAAYASETATERYYCRFGLNPDYVPTLVQHGLRISGTDAEGEPRIVEIPDNRFFVVTLFVPQTSSLPDRPHPLVSAFLAASARVR